MGGASGVLNADVKTTRKAGGEVPSGFNLGSEVWLKAP